MDVTVAGSEPRPSRPLLRRQFDERLGLIYPIRQLTTVLAGGAIGFCFGVSFGAKTAALRFRAENAHRLPTTHKGWYLYHKSKNYYAMWAGLKEGGRMGLRLAFWPGLFVAFEETIDNWRHGTKDALSTVIAGMACSGAFSAWNRFSLPEAARTAKVSLLLSVGLGFGQDAVRLLRGKEISYINFMRRKMHRE